MVYHRILHKTGEASVISMIAPPVIIFRKSYGKTLFIPDIFIIRGNLLPVKNFKEGFDIVSS
jgi:hypothetical protein